MATSVVTEPKCKYHQLWTGHTRCRSQGNNSEVCEVTWARRGVQPALSGPLGQAASTSLLATQLTSSSSVWSQPLLQGWSPTPCCPDCPQTHNSESSWISSIAMTGQSPNAVPRLCPHPPFSIVIGPWPQPSKWPPCIYARHRSGHFTHINSFTPLSNSRVTEEETKAPRH